jgi:hypothetical protein
MHVQTMRRPRATARLAGDAQIVKVFSVKAGSLAVVVCREAEA